MWLTEAGFGLPLTPTPAPRPGPRVAASALQESRTGGPQAPLLAPQAGEGLGYRFY